MASITKTEVLYCPICTYPFEYCEFGGQFTKCKKYVQENHPDIYEKLYSEDGIVSATSNLTLTEKQSKIERDLQKQQAKDEAKADRELQKKLQSKVIIKRIERTKRKHVIAISGLEVFGLDMKKLAKVFSSKFATGASVTKNIEKKDEIIIQGDVGDEVEEYLTTLLEEKGLTEVKLEQVEEKKKKKVQPLPPPQ